MTCPAARGSLMSNIEGYRCFDWMTRLGISRFRFPHMRDPARASL